MKRCVDRRNVMYCRAWVVSYAGIICAVHIRRKRSVGRCVKRLVYRIAVCR
jgi:hypothetical protein